MRNAVSRSLRKSPQFAGIFAGSDTGHAVSAANEDRPEAVWGLPSLACLSSLASEIRFPVRGEGRGQRLGLHATETYLPKLRRALRGRHMTASAAKATSSRTRRREDCTIKSLRPDLVCGSDHARSWRRRRNGCRAFAQSASINACLTFCLAISFCIN